MATSKQGIATIKALQDKGVKSIIGTSRNPESGASKAVLESNDAVTTMLKVNLDEPETIVAALQESKAKRVWFTTDYWSIHWPTRAKEFQLGKNVVDAIKQFPDQIEHVVYSSVGDADNCPQAIQHFWSKADVEKHMEEELKDSKTTWAVLRPVSFFENLANAEMKNPLKKGVVKGFSKPDSPQKYITVEDIGKGCAVLLLNPEDYASKKIEAAGALHTGPELAKALTEASGTDCVYKVVMPRWLMWLVAKDLYHMVNWLESDGYSADIEAFKKLVPDAKDAKAFFASIGEWADGEKFAPKD